MTKGLHSSSLQFTLSLLASTCPKSEDKTEKPVQNVEEVVSVREMKLLPFSFVYAFYCCFTNYSWSLLKDLAEDS